MSETKYFLASDALISRIEEINLERSAAIVLAEAFAKQYGGDAPLYQSGRVVGLDFSGAAPAGWSKPKYTGGVRFSRPLKTKAEGKEAYEHMREIPRLKSWKDVLALVGLEGHSALEAPPKGTVGFTMKYSTGDYVGDQLVIEVPDADSYKGHDLLTEISKADYLQMQADHEKQKEQAA